MVAAKLFQHQELSQKVILNSASKWFSEKNIIRGFCSGPAGKQEKQVM
jgi:hypothetical protein